MKEHQHGDQTILCKDSKNCVDCLRAEVADKEEELSIRARVIQEMELQLSELTLAWAELKTAEAANVPSGEFREDDLLGDRVRTAKDRLNLALDGITEKPKCEHKRIPLFKGPNACPDCGAWIPLNEVPL